MRQQFAKLTGVLALLSVSSCVYQPPAEPETVLYSRPPATVDVYAAEAPIPEGVVRYCWEEPIVKYEKQGPGLDTQGHYYHPAYLAVREVRMGKWRPCDAPPDGK